MRSRPSCGFTLIELMIVVAIVAILAAVAYPSYMEQVRKTRRADCAAELVGLGNAMERYFTENGTYVGASVGNNAGDIYPAQCPIDGGNAYYTFGIPVQTASTFTIQAAPTAGGPQAGDKCGTLTYTNTGVKSNSAGLGLEECWK